MRDGGGPGGGPAGGVREELAMSRARDLALWVPALRLGGPNLPPECDVTPVIRPLSGMHVANLAASLGKASI